MYKRKTWYFENSIEREFNWVGKYGRKGEKRDKRKKATPEQMKIQNQKNRENRVRRVMKANFGENDYWNTLKYPAGTKKEIDEVKSDIRKFLEKLRKGYKRKGETLKFVYRVEIGKRGSPHVHILVNRIPEADLIIKNAWVHGGVNFKLAYEEGGFRKLAEYLVKPPGETETDKAAAAYSTSRNLIRPEPEKKTYFRWTMEKMLREGIKATPGFYIVPDTVVSGKNPYTGMSYLKYEEVKLKKGEKSAGSKRICGNNS